MYAGRKVEEAPVQALFRTPRHPYTRGLMASVPRLERAAEAGPRPRLMEIAGMVPSLKDRPRGCTFAARCSFASEQCRNAYPPLEEKVPGHFAACWHSALLPGAADG
jgi:oligopeptide/dipeptide ABC transporter ATP-binding protein